MIEYLGHDVARIEDHRHGGHHHRYLNVTGRWSARGTRTVPLLSWHSFEEAEAAVAVASKARSAELCWSSLGGDSFSPEHFAAFGDHHAAALVGYLPYATAKARKLEEIRVRTMDFARAVLRVHQATTREQFEQLEKSEGHSLFRAYRTSVFGARQFLTGKKAAEVLGMLETGELNAEPDLSVEGLRRAIKIAIYYDSLVHEAAEARRL